MIPICLYIPGFRKLIKARNEDANGNYFGYARSIWTAIDLETRRPTNVEELYGLTDYVNDKPCPVEGASKIPLLKDDAEQITSFDVKYSDIDINKHLNSIKYIEHFVDVFPLEMYQEKEIGRFEITYIHEGQYGTALDIVQKKDSDDMYILEMRNAEKAICSARVKWK